MWGCAACSLVRSARGVCRAGSWEHEGLVSDIAINEMVRRATTLTSRIRRIIDMKIRSIGIDLGKTTFHLVALGERGKILLKKKLSRKQLLALTANLPA